MIHVGNWLFRHRNRVFPLVLCGLLMGFKPRLFGGSLSSDLRLDLVGTALALLGQGLRATVVGYAYIKRGGLNKKVHAHALVTNGLFAHARNPLYLGNLMILMGLFIVHNHPAVYLLGVLFFGLAYIAIVSAEEAYLEIRFGAEYGSYCAHLPRWRPRLRGIRATLAAMQFNWRRVLAKEFSSFVVWGLTITGLLVYEATLDGAAISARRGAVLTGVGLLLISLFVLIGFAKRRGRLTAAVI